MSAKNGVIVQCGQCEKDLYRRPWQIKKFPIHFCNRKCQGAYKAGLVGENNPTWTQVKVNCAACGTELTRKRSRVGRTEESFCNNICRGVGQTKRMTGESNPRYNKSEVPCSNCGKSLLRDQSDLKEKSNHFCNRKCYDEYSRSPEVPCANCGKILKRPPVRLRRTESQFCNSTCRGEKMSGEGNTQWQGGAIDYYGPNWRKQRRAARARDLNACQHCKVIPAKGRRLHDVHHIRPFREFGYIPGENDNYKLANNLANLITLCAGCHRLAEHGKIALQPKLF